MIDVIYILLMAHNMTDPAAFAYVDAAIENNVSYKFYYYPRGVYTTINTGIGDCTDKAQLKCYILNKRGTRCRTVHGYINKTKHDFIQYKFNNSWISSEPTKVVGVGIW